MNAGTTGPTLDPLLCERARKSKDPRFDGLFFTAVRTTGIYCRPVCPAPSPASQNVEYFALASECEAHGYRPCLRCRPELSPPALRDVEDELVRRASAKVHSGYLTEHTLQDLAAELGCSPRQLSRRFVKHFGVTPSKMHGTKRLLFAKQLLSESSIPVTQIAFAAGFSSLRRFNDAFQKAYRLSPRSIRSKSSNPAHNCIEIRLNYRPPFDFQRTLDWLRLRLLEGVEAIEEQSYLRRLTDLPGRDTAWIRIQAHCDYPHALKLELHGVLLQEIRGIVAGIRRMFDLDANPRAIAETLRDDPRLDALLQARPGIRIPGALDGFETLVRAIIGQQISVRAAHTLTQRLLRALQAPDPKAPHPKLFFAPLTPTSIAQADFNGLGFSQRRVQSLRCAANATLSGDISFDPSSDFKSWEQKLCALPGVGPWTAAYVALRALGHPDVFPAGDLVLRKFLSSVSNVNQSSKDQVLLSPRAVEKQALAWRPFRSYAAFYIWNS